MMMLSDNLIRYTVARMGHSHDHHDHHHHDPVLERCRELMHEDHRAAIAKVEVAVAKVASPIWRFLAAFGIYKY